MVVSSNHSASNSPLLARSSSLNIMLCPTSSKTPFAVRSAPVQCRRAVRARAENKQENRKDDLNDSAKDDMKYVLREDMSNLTTTPDTKPETLPQAAKDTLEPRVRELRGKKLAKGTTDFGGAFWRGAAPWRGHCAEVCPDRNWHNSTVPADKLFASVAMSPRMPT